MMKSLLSLGLLLLCLSSKAQQVIVFNEEKLNFGENQALPAETPLLLTCPLPNHIDRVELRVLPAESSPQAKTIYLSTWQRGWNKSDNPACFLALNAPLRQNTHYDFYFAFYQKMNKAEVDSLQAQIQNHLKLYLQQIYRKKGRKLRLQSRESAVMNQLKELIIREMLPYRSQTQIAFLGFSPLVKGKLQQIERIKINKKNPDNTQENELAELLQLLGDELKPLFQQDFYRLSQDRYVRNYPTERKKNILSLNASYLALPLNFSGNNFNYTSGFALGLSFPFGRRAFSPFWHRMAFSAGLILPQLKDRYGTAVEAPFTRIPLYLGLGYRPWRFLRIQAGLSVLEAPNSPNSVPGLSQALEFRPYLGLGIEFNIWADLAQ